MKYKCTIDINLPIDKTVALWSDENNFKEWQDGFKSIEHLSGTPNTEGAKARIILQEERSIVFDILFRSRWMIFHIAICIFGHRTHDRIGLVDRAEIIPVALSCRSGN